jgi:hypothetical protein
VSRWRERVPRHRGRLRRCGRRVRPRAGWLRFRFHRRRLSPGPPFRSAHDRSCRASSPQWLEQGDTTRQGTMLVTRTTFRARTGEQLQCHVPLLPCASFALEAERSSASVDFEAIRIAWIGGPVVSHAGIFADCEKEQVPRRMSFRGASSLGEAFVLSLCGRQLPTRAAPRGRALQGERHRDSSRRKNGSSRTTNGLDPANGLA